MDSCTPWGVDLFECDRVHLPVGYAGVSRKDGRKKVFLRKERGKEYFFAEGERKGRSRRVGDHVSVMTDNIQSLPRDLRTNHPKRWTEEDGSVWMKGWGSVFISAAVTQLQNGVDLSLTHGRSFLNKHLEKETLIQRRVDSQWLIFSQRRLGRHLT